MPQGTRDSSLGDAGDGQAEARGVDGESAEWRWERSGDAKPSRATFRDISRVGTGFLSLASSGKGNAAFLWI